MATGRGLPAVFTKPSAGGDGRRPAKKESKHTQLALLLSSRRLLVRFNRPTTMNPPRYPAPPRAPAAAAAQGARPSPLLLAPVAAAAAARPPPPPPSSSPSVAAAAAGDDQQQQVPPQKNFSLLKEIGRGSFGAVYLCQRRSDGRHYALKQLCLLKSSEAERAAALQECRFLASLRHPNCIKLRESFLSSGSKLNIVMDLAKGGDVGKLVFAARQARLAAAAAGGGGSGGARVGLPEPLVWSLLLQTASGLAACHALKVLHRDVKPGNVFLMSPCPPSLSGLPADARNATAAPSSSSSDAFPLLKVGDLGVAKAAEIAMTNAGTPFYQAPEIQSGRPYGAACDGWSLGVMCYELCALRVPFGASATTPAELRARVLDGRYAPLPELPTGAAAGGNGGSNAGYSAALVKLIDGLLSRDPTRRPTCADVIAGPWARAWAWTVPEEARGALLAAGASGGIAAVAPPKPKPTLIPAIKRVNELPEKNYSSDGGVPAVAAAPPPPVRVPARGGELLAPAAAAPSAAAAKVVAAAALPSARGRVDAGGAAPRPLLPGAASPYAYSPGGAAVVRPPSAAVVKALGAGAAGVGGPTAAAAAAAAAAAKARAAAAAVPSWMK
jgi:NIMA (never in mitosis gene a)-related kinase